MAMLILHKGLKLEQYKFYFRNESDGATKSIAHEN